MVKDLSVFFPCFNEEKNIETTVKKAIKVLDDLKLNYEIIIVNDGSRDDTGNVVHSLAQSNPKIYVINHPKNLGYGESLKSGFYNAKYNTIVYTDSDGQFDFSQVTRFLDKLDESDLIIGFRIKRADPLIRILFAKGWALSLFTFFGLKLKDVDCGFKMIKKKVLKSIPPLESTRGGMINAELAIKAKKYGFNVSEVGVDHYPRLSGKPTGANIKVIFKSYLDLFKLWWKLKDQKIFFLCLVAILLLASVTRLYRIDEYMTFLGDEGRDALIIKRILTQLDLPLIGPPTSIGNIYLGPLYYYLMAFPMAILWLNPMAAAIMVASLGVGTVLLIYYLGRKWFGKKAGLLSAFLYTISPVTIIYSRSSWNPNPAPFFSLLTIIGLYKAHAGADFRWLILSGGAVAFAVQMHYLALILLPVVFVLWSYELFRIWRRKIENRYFYRGSILALLVFLLLMSPLVVFDFKHNFLNYRAITAFFSQRETTINLNPLNTTLRVIPIYNHNLIGRYMTGENPYLTPMLSVLIITILVWSITGMVQARKIAWPDMALGVWLGIGIAGLALYKQNVYDHYLGFINPVPYLLMSSLLRQGNKFFIGGLIILVVALVIVNLQNNPLMSNPNRQLQRTQGIARFIIKLSAEKPFNFALLAKNNYDAAYQFYLDIYNHKPKVLPDDKTDQLFVVCEDPVCEPIGHPKYEIAAYGWAKIESQTDFEGVKVYKLVPNPSGKPQYE